jgi:hypothetical protein
MLEVLSGEEAFIPVIVVFGELVGARLLSDNDGWWVSCTKLFRCLLDGGIVKLLAGFIDTVGDAVGSNELPNGDG